MSISSIRNSIDYSTTTMAAIANNETTVLAPSPPARLHPHVVAASRYHTPPRPVFLPASIPTGSRSLSLSPTHLVGRRRFVNDPTLLVPGNNMPFLAASATSEVPPRFSDTQRAMEHAVAEERKRAKQMEEQEKDLSADELRKILKQERHRMSNFARTIAELRSTAVQCQSEAEIHEEGRINSLLGRLERMQMEKGRIINELEREEEMITNTLQKKLDQVKKEKSELEKLIEREQLSHSDLHAQLSDVRTNQQNERVPSPTAVGMAGVPTGLSFLEEGSEGEEDAELEVDLPDLAGIATNEASH